MTAIAADRLRLTVFVSTLIIGSQSSPLFAQPLEVVDAWAEGFERAWKAILQR